MRSTTFALVVLFSLTATVAHAAPVINGANVVINASNADWTVTISGQGLGTPSPSETIWVVTYEPAGVISSTWPQCSGSTPPCVTQWNPQLIVVTVPLTTNPAKRVSIINFATNPFQTSETAPVDHYDLRWFDSNMQGASSPSQLAIDMSPPSASPEPPRRLFGYYEFHTTFKQLNPAAGSVNEMPIGRASEPIFRWNNGASFLAQNAEEMIADPYGRIWFTEGGRYTQVLDEEHNHSRIIRFDPSNDEYCVYNIPGNNNEAFGIAYEKDAPSGGDRVWFVETRVFAGGAPRLTWFDPDEAFCDVGDGTYAYRDDPATCTGGTCVGSPDRPCYRHSDCLFGAPTQKCSDGICQDDVTSCSTDENCPITPVAICPAGSDEDGCIYHYYEIPAFSPAQVTVDPSHAVWVSGYWDFFGFNPNIFRIDPYAATPSFKAYPLHPGTWEIEAAPVLPTKTHPDIVVTSQTVNKLDLFDSSRWNDVACTTLVGGNNPCVTTIDLTDSAFEVAFDRQRRIWFTGGNATIGYLEHASKQLVRLPPLSVFPFELAERKEAKQNTTANGLNDASRAVDGDKNTYAKTNPGPNQWWRVDVRRPVKVHTVETGLVGKVKIWANSDTTTNYTVELQDKDGAVLASQPTGTLNAGVMNQKTLTFADTEARYVKISAANGGVKLNEVQVLSLNPPDDGAPAIAVDVSNNDVWFTAFRRRAQIGRLRPIRSNRALGKPATQSPYIFGGPHLAVDGDIFGGIPATISLPEPYWQVDLEKIQQVTDINVWGCPPGFPNCPVLQDFKVLVSDSPITGTDLSYLCSSVPSIQCYHVSGPVGRPSTVAINRTARYVRVQVEWPPPQQAALRLAEVEVMGGSTCPASCDDGNPCTEDSCRGGQCDHIGVIGGNGKWNGAGWACGGPNSSETCQNILGKVCCTDAIWNCVTPPGEPSSCGFWTQEDGVFIDPATTYFTIACP